MDLQSVSCDPAFQQTLFVRPTKIMRQRGSLLHVREQEDTRRKWNWIHFFCGFVVVALLVFFDTSMPFFARFWPHLAETIVLSSLGGALTALFGEAAFVRILRW
jgi:hypothetical protein